MSVEEWDRRQLCSDGGCTGVIGPTGQCKTCNRAAANWGDERKRGMRNTTDAPLLAAKPPATVSADDDIVPSAPAAMGAGLAAGGWNSRQLCTDGSCVGLLGADGTCKVCGAPASGGVVGRGESSGETAYEDDGDFEDDDEDEDDEDDEDLDDEDDGEDEPDEGDQDAGVIAARGAQETELAAAATALAATAQPGDVAGLVGAPVDRELCSDGACVGVIGLDKHCSVCGKTREAS